MTSIIRRPLPDAHCLSLRLTDDALRMTFCPVFTIAQCPVPIACSHV